MLCSPRTLTPSKVMTKTRHTISICMARRILTQTNFSLKPLTPPAITFSQSMSTWTSISTSVCPTVMTKWLKMRVNPVQLSILLQMEEEKEETLAQTKNSSCTSKLYLREDRIVSDNRGRRRLVGQTHGHQQAPDIKHNYSSKIIWRRRRIYPIMGIKHGAITWLEVACAIKRITWMTSSKPFSNIINYQLKIWSNTGHIYSR